MPGPHSYPTPYPQVNALLDALLTQVQTILQEQFIGMYLYGSLALGDFNLDHSDIDFVVVTRRELAGETFLALQAMHERIATGSSKWVIQLEGSYIPQRALRRYDPAQTRHPHIDRGQGERLKIMQHDRDWIIQRHVLHKYGVTLAGPSPHTLIDPISANELRHAVLDILSHWVAPMLHDTTPIDSPGYHGYIILTMCRMLYTMQHGVIVSKPVAARWALEALDERWHTHIEHALQGDVPLAHLEQTLAFIQYTIGAMSSYRLVD